MQNLGSEERLGVKFKDGIYFILFFIFNLFYVDN